VQGSAGPGQVGKWEIEVTPNGEFSEVELLGSDGERYIDASGRQATDDDEDA
jgi:hypothetical protein